MPINNFSNQEQQNNNHNQQNVENKNKNKHKARKNSSSPLESVDKSDSRTKLAEKIGEKALNSKVGQNLANKGANALNKIPGLGMHRRKVERANQREELNQKYLEQQNSQVNDNADKTKNNIGNNESENKEKAPDDKEANKKDKLGSAVKKAKGIKTGINDFKNTGGFAGIWARLPLPTKLMIIGAIVSIALILILIFAILSLLNNSIFGIMLGMDTTEGRNQDYISDYDITDKEEQKFYERVMEVKEEYQSAGKYFDSSLIIGVYHVVTTYNEDFDYKDMSKGVIREIATAMNKATSTEDGGETYSYDKETFKEQIQSFLSRKVKNKNVGTDKMVDQIFQYLKDYEDYIGKNKKGSSSSCGALGTCTYELTGLHGTKLNNPISVTNLKVRLMNCADLGRGNPVEGEELVDFEKYVLGVTYGEVGEAEEDVILKTEAVAARTFALSRVMGMAGQSLRSSSTGIGLFEENGQWILEIRNCTEDQVYCDPDRGCSNTTQPSVSGNGTTLFSGAETKPFLYKGPLPTDANIRKVVAETVGQVMVNSEGSLTIGNYVVTDLYKWQAKAAAGLDYKQILIEHYSSNGTTDIKQMSCNTSGNKNCSVTTGDFVNWKQYDPAWGSIRLEPSSETIQSVGCLVTSISMLIAKSGVPTNVDGEFNPGTFVQKASANGGFTGGGGFIWSSLPSVTTNFTRITESVKIHDLSESEKFATIQDLLNKGYYLVAEVKGDTGQHWVAIDSISGSTINMFDPGSEATSLWDEYPSSNTSELICFEVK